jgi:hypothetical protein
LNGLVGVIGMDFYPTRRHHQFATEPILEFRAEAYNVFNHFNPGNPNTSLTLNYANGANTNANFGTITSAVGQARRMALAVKFRF